MTLRRRNSIATSVLLPHHLTLPRPLSSTFSATATATSSSSSSSSATSSSEYFSLHPLSYTSLKDLIPGAAAHSPTAAASPAGSEISIRNRLVKQAAWAYLQPMSASTDSAADHLFRRVFDGVLGSPLFSLLRAVARALINAFCFCFR